MSEIVFGMGHGWPYEGFQKNPSYTSSDHHWNLRGDLYDRILIFRVLSVSTPGQGSLSVMALKCRNCLGDLKKFIIFPSLQSSFFLRSLCWVRHPPQGFSRLWQCQA
jgi:hypothetical protein